MYPALPESKEENWSFDMLEGFKLQNATWETTGNYIVEGFYTTRQLKFDKSDISFQKDKYIDKKYTFPFSIQVEGFLFIWHINTDACEVHLLKCVFIGVEVVSSNPQLVWGKPFSLICRWIEPMFSSVISNEKNERAYWSWTPHQENYTQSEITPCELKLYWLIA